MGVTEEKQNLVHQSSGSIKKYGTISEKVPKEISTFGRKKSYKSKTAEYIVDAKSKISVWTLFHFRTKTDMIIMIFGSIFAVINGAGWPLLALVFGQMTDVLLFHAPNQSIVLYDNSSMQGVNPIPAADTTVDFEKSMKTFSLYYVYIGLAVLFSSIFQILCWVTACERQIYSLRQQFFYEVLRQEIAWFDLCQSGELATGLNDDLERVREGIGDKFSLLIQYCSTFISGFVVGFAKGWQLTLVIMAMTPLLTIFSGFMGKFVSTSSAREQEKYAIASGIAEEVLSNVKTVTAFNGQEREIKRYDAALTMGMKIAKKKYIYISFAFGFTFLILYGSYAIAFWFGSKLVIANKMTPGDVFSVFFAVMIGSFSLGNAVPYLTTLSIAKGSAVKIFEVMNSVPKIDPYSKDGIQPANFTANIEFHDVKFCYPSRKSVEVLKTFTLSIKEGQTVALCGPSGSGKSTIVNLIQRFYDPQKGCVTLGDFNLKTLNVHWLRSKIGIVSQEPVLFSGSIGKNIENGYEGITFPEIVAAAKMANAHDFIVQLPQGYDTLVGERGAQLSGGQKQRIAIARALARDPKILLLDEATSALDAENESIVQEALEKARKGRTTIVIAHRLSTIRTADVICVMENGELKEQGSHQELMAQHGLYHQLVTSQTFVDQDICTSKEGHAACRKDSELFQKLLKKRSSVWSAIHEGHRLITRLESEAKEENIQLPSVLQILKQCKAEWKEITIGCLASVITGMTMPAFAVFYSEMFYTYTLTGTALKESAFFWSMMFLVLAVVTCLGNIFRTIGYTFAGEALAKKLRLDSFINILRQDAAWFDNPIHSSGKLTTRLATDVPIVRSAAGIRIGTVISALITLVSSIVIAFIFGWKLALALMIIVPILLVSGAIQMSTLRGKQLRDAELMEAAGEVACEGIENIKTVQSFTLEAKFYESYVENLLVPFMENKKNARIYALAYGFSQGVMFFTYAAAFRLGGYLVETNQMNTTNIYRVFFAMAFSAVTVGQWTSFLPDYAKAKLSAGLIFNLMETVPQIDSSSNGGIKPQEIKGKICFSNVYFRYPNRRDILVLQGINLTINPGETLALVGSSGCGKSTLLALLGRSYDPEKGQVKLDGFDVKTINPKYLRSLMAIVSQEPVLFNCSIKENITYGIEDKVPQSDIEKAARTANIHDFILQLPQGYETIVGERGANLSGGQKQRVAIARAIVRDPKILLLDEATSALDSESEKAVQVALDDAKQGRTCIIIAHRLSTVQNADCIAVIDHGKIVEKGTHQNLINKKGFYYKLIKKQYN